MRGIQYFDLVEVFHCVTALESNMLVVMTVVSESPIAKRAALPFHFIYILVLHCFGFCNCCKLFWPITFLILCTAFSKLRHTHVTLWPVSRVLLALSFGF